MDGIIPLWKERGMTSHDCVFKMRKLLKTKKVGHAGTLDPNVEGVLPICIGRGTKLVDYLHERNKTYLGEVTLGIATTTEDSDGDIIESKKVINITNEEIDDVLSKMIGEMVQIPPMYSAVKVNGRKLYEYAREGIEVERPERHIMIESLQRVNDVTCDDGRQCFSFVVTCSKGTYVRTLAVDIGKALGVPSHMSKLVRLESAGYKAKDAYRLATLTEASENGTLSDYILPLETVVATMPKMNVTKEEYKKVCNGMRFKTSDVPEFSGEYIAMMYHQKLIAIYTYRDDNQEQLKLWRMIEVEHQC